MRHLYLALFCVNLFHFQNTDSFSLVPEQFPSLCDIGGSVSFTIKFFCHHQAFVYEKQFLNRAVYVGLVSACSATDITTWFSFGTTTIILVLNSIVCAKWANQIIELYETRKDSLDNVQTNIIYGNGTVHEETIKSGVISNSLNFFRMLENDATMTTNNIEIGNISIPVFECTDCSNYFDGAPNVDRPYIRSRRDLFDALANVGKSVSDGAEKIIRPTNIDNINILLAKIVDILGVFYNLS